MLFRHEHKAVPTLNYASSTHERECHIRIVSDKQQLQQDERLGMDSVAGLGWGGDVRQPI